MAEINSEKSKAGIPKFNEEEKLQICRWIAEFRSDHDIVSLIKQNFNKSCAITNIINNYRNGNRWKVIINRLQQEWAAGVMNIPLAHKRGRIEHLVNLVERSEADTSITDQSRRRETAWLINQIRLEMDESKTNFTQIFMTSLTSADENELLKRRDELITKLQRYKIRPLLTQAIDVESVNVSGNGKEREEIICQP